MILKLQNSTPPGKLKKNYDLKYQNLHMCKGLKNRKPFLGSCLLMVELLTSRHEVPYPDSLRSFDVFF